MQSHSSSPSNMMRLCRWFDNVDHAYFFDSFQILDLPNLCFMPICDVCFFKLSISCVRDPIGYLD